jgi:hypothetical protein
VAAQVTRVTVKGFKKWCVSSAVEGLVGCEMTVERLGLVVASVRKMKALIGKMESVILIGKDRWNMTCFMH